MYICLLVYAYMNVGYVCMYLCAYKCIYARNNFIQLSCNFFMKIATQIVNWFAICST